MGNRWPQVRGAHPPHHPTTSTRAPCPGARAILPSMVTSTASKVSASATYAASYAVKVPRKLHTCASHAQDKSSHSVPCDSRLAVQGDHHPANADPRPGPRRPARAALRRGRREHHTAAPPPRRPRPVRDRPGAGRPRRHDRAAARSPQPAAQPAPVRRAGALRLCPARPVHRALRRRPGPGAGPAGTPHRRAAGGHPAHRRHRPAGRTGRPPHPVARGGAGRGRDAGAGRLGLGDGRGGRAAQPAARQHVPHLGPRCLGADGRVGGRGTARGAGIEACGGGRRRRPAGRGPGPRRAGRGAPHAKPVRRRDRPRLSAARARGRAAHDAGRGRHRGGQDAGLSGTGLAVGRGQRASGVDFHLYAGAAAPDRAREPGALCRRCRPRGEGGGA